MPRGTRSVLRALFGKKRSSLYISQEKGDRYYIQTRHNDLFFSISIFFSVNLEKNWPEKRIVLMLPGHSIILLKSN